MVLLMKDPTKLKFKEKDYIAKCINRSQIKNNRLFKENNFELMIGKGHLVWNYIYSNLKHTFRNNNKFTVNYIQNYSWKQIYLYNKFEKELYIIMKENTFIDIIKGKKKQHLIAALANINDGDIENIPKRYKDELLKLDEVPKRSIIITFNYDENLKKGKYKAIRITPNLVEIESEEWNGK